ncbi:hypothetical protein UNH65_04925 [Chitinophaga sp. 180180018-2]|nr:hypothetical protein [Chitinophaga sp. 212800010-3]
MENSKGRIILVNAVWHYENGDLDTRQKIIGSMFPSKLIFDKNDYRIIEPNPILELIVLPVKDLEVSKKGKVGTSSDLSFLVHRRVFFLNRFQVADFFSLAPSFTIIR